MADELMCPVCLDELTPSSDVTAAACGHTFCSTCLNQWARASPSCPVCRKPVDAPLAQQQTSPVIGRRWGDERERAEARAQEELELEERLLLSAAEARAAELVQQARAAGRDHAVPTIRERIEAEHRARSAARVRQIEFERRVESYMSFTPSGRPYDELPVCALSDIRGVEKENKRNIAGALRNTAHSYLGSCY